MENHEESLYEMANVSKSDTGLPYEIWIDSEGKDRKNKHHVPRLRVEVDGDRIPVSIKEEPKILVDKDSKNYKKISDWIKKYLSTLLAHWNKEITDREALSRLGR